jgi:type VI secretion system protein ImpA
MAEIDVDAFLAPVTDTAPCGEDLEYDPAFQVLEEAARGKPEQQFGDTVIAAQEPDWRAMQEQAIALFGRTRDLRVAIYLLRANARLNGFAGFASGIKLVRGLLEQHWDQVYPQLDASDHNDPTMRLNSLAPLADPTGMLADPANVLADLRQALVGNARDGMTVRQIELGLGKAEPNSSESAPTAAGVVDALRAACEQFPGLLGQLVGVHADVRAIETVIDSKVGAANGPELRQLRVLTQHLAQATELLRDPDEVAAVAGATGEGAAPVARASGGGIINNRDDAIKALDRVCEWISRNEPTNPAPLLIRRAQRLMTKSFMDIIRDMAPDALVNVERIAGVDSE